MKPTTLKRLTKQAKQPKVYAADLFCGAGGTSTGLREACEQMGAQLKLVAINHWEIAIATHSDNHPNAEHLCASVDSVDPRKCVPGGRLQLLIAAPECTHHSRARGGKPRNDQSRASAWLVLRWLEMLTVDNVLIENVPDFVTWGPLGSNGKPLKKRKGETFNAFITALKSLNYNVDWKVLNCANYGDPTTRERLFIMARRGRKPINWPAPTHSVDGAKTLFGEMEKWRAAREIIDWSLPGQSIFDPGRKRPLSPNTMKRIVAGLRKFSGLPFVLPNEGYFRGNAPRSVEKPVPAVTQRGAGAVVHPFVLSVNGGKDGYLRGSSVDAPLPAITAHPTTALVEPYIISMEHSNGKGRMQPFVTTVNHGKDETRTYPISKPMPTITSVDAWALIEPFIVMLNGTTDKAVNRSSRSVSDPLPTVVGSAPHLYLAQPFLTEYHGGKDSHKRVHSVEEPLPTQDTSNRFGLAQPFLVQYHGTNEGGKERVRSVDKPMPTVAGDHNPALVMPYITKYYGSSKSAQSVDEPLDTVTATDRFGLVEPVVQGTGYGVPLVLADGSQAILDIRFRMLQPHELAAAMSFPKEYKFAGKRRDVVKQIGNAVPTRTAEALCLALLDS